jgi:hypothetical protein
MGKMKDRVSSPPSDQAISAGNWVDRAMVYIRSHDGCGFVIRAFEGENGEARTKKPQTEAQWHAWVVYLASRNIPHAAMIRLGCATVPCEWPEDFDPACPFSDRLWKAPWKPAPVYVDRQRIIDLFAGLSVSLGPKPRRKIDDYSDARHAPPDSAAAIRAFHENRLREIQAFNAANPVRV